MSYVLYFLALIAFFYWIISFSVPDPNRPEIVRANSIGILVFAVFFGGFGYFVSLNPAYSVYGPASSHTKLIVHASEKSYIEVLDYSLQNGFVVGKIKNHAEFPYSSVIFGVDLYDDAGAKLGTTVGVLFSVGPGEERAFKIPANGEHFSAQMVKNAKIQDDISAQTYK